MIEDLYNMNWDRFVSIDDLYNIKRTVYFYLTFYIVHIVRTFLTGYLTLALRMRPSVSRTVTYVVFLLLRRCSLNVETSVLWPRQNLQVRGNVHVIKDV